MFSCAITRHSGDLGFLQVYEDGGGVREEMMAMPHWRWLSEVRVVVEFALAVEFERRRLPHEEEAMDD
ncbi:uncharacterized protein HKW66_Vig0144150 [Vigna angularis]|uniref:Uncharacterized protein n=1 Tax=Phaseolus angularis TaxID=3914 RepID=A0A8T0KDN4_PHAAN|nr:uncharacterized protein HKW66_Vig0144150 [Vigna angularis]